MGYMEAGVRREVACRAVPRRKVRAPAPPRVRTATAWKMAKGDGGNFSGCVGAADDGAGEHHGGAAVLDLVLRETPAARGSKAAGLPRSGSGRAHGRNPVRSDGGLNKNTMTMDGRSPRARRTKAYLWTGENVLPSRPQAILLVEIVIPDNL
jgi:hypothetical protein